MFRWFTIIFLLSYTFGQDFSVYQNLIDEGKIIEVQKSLTYLESQYPNHPFVLYVKAATILDGEQAVAQYRFIIDKHPSTKAAEMASIKVAEYLYSAGLYTQASDLLKSYPNLYHDSDYSEKVFDVLKKSLMAIGEDDSIKYYQNIFSEEYPDQNFNTYNLYHDLIAIDAQDDNYTDQPIAEEIIAVEQEDKLGDKPWVIQVGAFGERDNANVIVNRLKSAGYEVEVVEKTDRVNLYLVQIVRFKTIEQAINIGEKLQDQFGLEFRIIERN